MYLFVEFITGNYSTDHRYGSRKTLLFWKDYLQQYHLGTKVHDRPMPIQYEGRN